MKSHGCGSAALGNDSEALYQGARSPGCWKVPNPDLALTRVNAMVARIENPDSGAIARLASGNEGKMT
jgi:hypothetical protein